MLFFAAFYAVGAFVLQHFLPITFRNDAVFLGALSDDSILTVLKKGKGQHMKSWSDKLNPAEMVSVVKYVRTLPTKKS